MSRSGSWMSWPAWRQLRERQAFQQAIQEHDMLMENQREYERQLAIHQLRVNVKSLAYEARTIRKEAQKARAECQTRYGWRLVARDSLDFHRRGRLRREARYAQLALGFLRGRKYRQVEQMTRNQPVASELHAKINRFFKVDLKVVEVWLQR